MLAMLAGAKRYAHVAGVRGVTKVVSEDAIRRAFKAIGEKEGAAWLRGHLAFCAEPLLAEPWILDVDTTIKPLYGHQEGAVLTTPSADFRAAVTRLATRSVRMSGHERGSPRGKIKRLPRAPAEFTRRIHHPGA